MTRTSFSPVTSPKRSLQLANLAGLLAIVMWSSLALLTTRTAAIPPFEVMFLSFLVPFVLSCITSALGVAGGFAAWRQPWGVWVSGFCGIFFYHAFYFFALKKAPAAQASLIAYLWPLLIVVLGSLCNGGRLKPACLLGASLGLLGTAVLLLPGWGGFSDAAIAGYLSAFAGALVWSSYSVWNKRYNGASPNVMGGICGGVAMAGLVCHLLFEQTVIPDAGNGVALLLLGLGPVGIAFFAWDYATKAGESQRIGALSYLAPLLSTLILVALDPGTFTWSILVAALLIVGGAVLAVGAAVRRLDLPRDAM
ncbi:DMT family transporter [Pseudomonas sp. JUb96]|uniref:DMT family transporter n=1 Tax=Pseudomonas sp. JUb96 TaxID=2940539 RepID=UPI002226C65F|nr:DMT family transporter [Pseudomonas sp. JUb96]MCW2271263.1 drug/metabolite transporter (DMT)-like permease [Pseudomonas sp. JUb96]